MDVFPDNEVAKVAFPLSREDPKACKAWKEKGKTGWREEGERGKKAQWGRGRAGFPLIR